MAKNIKLNSDYWCELVFENKNKVYGAYRLRQTSSKRHIAAFAITLLFVGSVVAIPSLISALKPDIAFVDGIDGDGHHTIAEFEEEKEKIEDIIPKEETMPKEEMRASIKYEAPMIVDDSQVNSENELKAVNDLLSDKDKIISSFENPDGSNSAGAPDPADVLKNNKITNNGGTTKPKDPILTYVPIMPDFPGGKAELMKFLNSNIKYPTIALESGIQGKVILSFVVEKDGSITDVKVARSLDPSCDKEAIRVVKMMPRWIPGKQNNQTVRVQFTLPVTYAIQK
jgi:protein TonB